MSLNNAERDQRRFWKNGLVAREIDQKISGACGFGYRPGSMIPTLTDTSLLSEIRPTYISMSTESRIFLLTTSKPSPLTPL